MNAAAEVLLGAGSHQLVGRRLIAVVPPEWRLAHLAGFARFQLTGESHIIGAPVTVATLCADGTTTNVELNIEPVAVTGGRLPSEDSSRHRQFSGVRRHLDLSRSHYAVHKRPRTRRAGSPDAQACEDPCDARERSLIGCYAVTFALACATDDRRARKTMKGPS